MLAREIHHLGDFRLRDLVGINPAFPDAVMVNMQHNAGRLFAVFLEEVLHNVNDELHRSVVIVQQQHSIEIWPLGYCFGTGDCNRSGVATVIVIIRARRHCRFFCLYHSGHHQISNPEHTALRSWSRAFRSTDCTANTHSQW